MKYRILLRFLHGLIGIKRFFWWLGTRFSFVLGKIVVVLATIAAWLQYRASSFFKKIGVPRNWLFKRNFLQIIVFIILAAAVLPESKVFATKNLAFSGQKTQAFQFFGYDQEAEIEEVGITVDAPQDIPSWRTGVIGQDVGVTPSGVVALPDQNFGQTLAGGTAIGKPVIMPGSSIGVKRFEETMYIVQPGDSLGVIAQAFDVSVASIMWDNNLTLRSLIKPGDTLKVPPVDGVMHTIKKGDTIKKIAQLYTADTAKIIDFNHLKPDGTDLKIGERIVVPDGQPQKSQIVAVPRSRYITTPAASHIATPPNSLAAAGSSGYIWPSGSHTITQYFGLSHHAIDIGGPWQTPTYAAAAGVVEKSQCGWNSGYGCYVIIDHGNGIKTLYGHHSQLLVSPGDYVDQGQVIALMGNTGNVRGVTGIHLHFEVQRNGIRVNPLGYVR